MTAATAIAAIGPAVAMIAPKCSSARFPASSPNIQLTTQTLKAIRNEQWAELEGLAESVDEAVMETANSTPSQTLSGSPSLQRSHIRKR